MTGPNVFDVLKAPDFERPAAHRLTPDGFVQVTTEWIVAQDADDERSSGVGKGAGRPVDKLSEVEEENGLHLVFRRARGLRPETGAPRQQHDPTEETRPEHASGGPQKCHSTRP